MNAKDTVITFRASKSDKEEIENMSISTGISKSEIVRLALKHHIKKFFGDPEKILSQYSDLVIRDKSKEIESMKWERSRTPEEPPEDDIFQ